MDEISQTIKSYDKSADWHSFKFDGYDWTVYLSKFMQQLKGRKVLDFGCGNGRDTEFFAKQKLEAVGIDYSNELFKRAKARVKNAKFLKANFLEPLKFMDNEFDGIWAWASLIHIEKKLLPKVLGEIKRILKKGGMLAISVKEGDGEKLAPDEYGTEKRFFSLFRKNELIEILSNTGFEVLESYEATDEKVRVNFEKNPGRQNWIIVYCLNKK